LSNALENFVGQSVILHGASQYYATDHRRYPKDGFFPAASDSSAASRPGPSGRMLSEVRSHGWVSR